MSVMAFITGGLIGGVCYCSKEIFNICFRKGKVEEDPIKNIPNETWGNIWYNNKLYKKDDEGNIFTPYLLDKYEMENGMKYFFKLPMGMTSEDVVSCRTQIKELFDLEDVKIYHYKSDTAMVELHRYKNEKILDFEQVWKACKVYISDKDDYKMPLVIDYKEKEDSEIFKFKAPVGITLGDFNKSKEAMKDFLNAKKIKFENLGNCKFSMEAIYNMENNVHELWDRFWCDLKIYAGDEKVGITVPQFLGEEDILGGKKYIFKMPVSKSTHDLKGKDVAIREFLDAESIKILPSDKKNVEIHAIYEKLPTEINYEKVERESKDVLEIVLGKKIGGWLRIKLDSGENGILITGKAGSGKSNCFKGMILDLALHFSPDMLKMYLTDFKLTELAPFKRLKHVVKYDTEVEELAKTIDELEKEMKRRYKLFEQYDVENIYEFNKKVPKDQRMPFILFAIEEISAFTVSSTGTEDGYNKKLSQLNYRSRGAGFMNLFCVQRMTNANIPREVSNSLGVRPSFKTADIKESEIVTGTKSIDLSTLRGKGHGMLIIGGEGSEFQAFKINHQEIKPMLEKHGLLKDKDENIEE